MNKKRTKKDNQETINSQKNGNKNSMGDNLCPIHVCEYGEKVESLKHQTECTNIPDNNHHYIEDADSLMTLEDFQEELYFAADNYFEELINELNQQKKDLASKKFNDSIYSLKEKLARINTWINLLEEKRDVLSGLELFALEYCISTYASECGPHERKKEIIRTLYIVKDKLKSEGINLDLFYNKIISMDVSELFELTEILLELDDIANNGVWELEMGSINYAKSQIAEKIHKDLSLLNNKVDGLKLALNDSTCVVYLDSIDVASKIIEYISRNPDFKKAIDEFNKEFKHLERNFYDQLVLNFLMLKSKCMPAVEIQKYFINVRQEKQGRINDENMYLLETKARKILNEFLKLENIRLKNALLESAKKYSLNEIQETCSALRDFLLNPGQREKDDFILFNFDNSELAYLYDIEFARVLPLASSEFSKALFVFLLNLSEESYSFNSNAGEIFDLREKLNGVLYSTYFDLGDPFILILMHIFNIDPELRQLRNKIYYDAKKKVEMVINQVNVVRS